ncbi:hypothetical protein KUTeg_010284 [Tegillarca granosa]|uniref:Arf-GAP domain-containing protein n=1 Tax=Tegillarca granosa TaxID=220873 RepID=A0ABQ9F9K8_TEGGR|nr:hypothetical protein KUTeg_010284 [Tegillarca granosa]
MMWTSTRSDMRKEHWVPNHFVVLLPPFITEKGVVVESNDENNKGGVVELDIENEKGQVEESEVENPTWASINRGVLICDECCSVHRSLGRHISQVKSLTKGQWNPPLLAAVQHLASHGANSIWEHSLLDPSQSKHGKKKPQPHDQVHPTKSEFIRSKYQFLQFVNKQKDGEISSLDDLSKQLHSSVRTNNLETCLRLLSKGADPNYFHPEKGNCPLHVAAQCGQPFQVELLVVYGADPGALDSCGKTPIDHARSEGYPDLADRLLECQFELTDRLAYYLCKRKPDHRSGIHFIIPEMADSLQEQQLKSNISFSISSVPQLPNHLFEELATDVYDEVDRRENDEHWAQTHDNTALVTDRQGVPFLPLNPDFSATRNQGRSSGDAVVEGPVSTDEFLQMKKQMSTLESHVQTLSNVNRELQRERDELYHLVQSLTKEISILRNHQHMQHNLPNGYDDQEEESIQLRPIKTNVRPQSMFEPRDQQRLTQKKPRSESIKCALHLLTTSTRRLQEECKEHVPLDTDSDNEPSVKTQQVMQCAFDIAKAAKQLVTLFQ